MLFSAKSCFLWGALFLFFFPSYGGQARPMPQKEPSLAAAQKAKKIKSQKAVIETLKDVNAIQSYKVRRSKKCAFWGKNIGGGIPFLFFFGLVGGAFVWYNFWGYEKDFILNNKMMVGAGSVIAFILGGVVTFFISRNITAPIGEVIGYMIGGIKANRTIADIKRGKNVIDGLL